MSFSTSQFSTKSFNFPTPSPAEFSANFSANQFSAQQLPTKSFKLSAAPQLPAADFSAQQFQSADFSANQFSAQQLPTKSFKLSAAPQLPAADFSAQQFQSADFSANQFSAQQLPTKSFKLSAAPQLPAADFSAQQFQSADLSSNQLSAPSSFQLEDVSSKWSAAHQASKDAAAQFKQDFGNEANQQQFNF